MHQSVFDSITGKTKDSEKEVSVDATFPMIPSAKDFLGKILMRFYPTNQTTTIGKLPKDLNPPKFLCNSFES